MQAFDLLITLFSLPVGAPHPDPRTIHAVAANRTGVVILFWNVPVMRSGELPITGYSILYHNKAGANNLTRVTISITQIELTGLDPGTTYQIFVASISAIGIGKYCCTSQKVFIQPHNG